MNITKTISYSVSFDEARKALESYQKDMIYEFLPTKDSFTRVEVAEFAFTIINDRTRQEAVEKNDIPWIDTPRDMRKWAELAETFPNLFFSEDQLNEMVKAIEENGVIVKVTIADWTVDVKEMLNNY